MTSIEEKEKVRRLMVEAERLARVRVQLDRCRVGESGLFQPQRLSAGSGANLQTGQFTHGSSSPRAIPIVPVGTTSRAYPTPVDTSADARGELFHCLADRGGPDGLKHVEVVVCTG